MSEFSEEIWLESINSIPASENFVQEKYFKEPLPEEKILKPLSVKVYLDGEIGERFLKSMWQLQLKILLRRLELLRRVKEKDDNHEKR